MSPGSQVKGVLPHLSTELLAGVNVVFASSLSVDVFVPFSFCCSLDNNLFETPASRAPVKYMKKGDLQSAAILKLKGNWEQDHLLSVECANRNTINVQWLMGNMMFFSLKEEGTFIYSVRRYPHILALTTCV